MVLKVIPSLHTRGKLSQVSPLSIKEIRANLRRQHSSYQGMRTITAIVPHDPPVHKTQRKSLRVDSQDPLSPQESPQEDPYRWLSNYAQLAVRDSSPMRRPPYVPYRPPAGLPPAPREDFHAYLEHPDSGPSFPHVMPAELTGSLLHPDHSDGTHPGLYYPYTSSVQGGCWQGPNPYFRNRFLEAYNAGTRKY